VRILVTGATGYIGGRLVPELLAAGHDVACLARSPQKLDDRPWRGDVEVHRGDLLDPGSLEAPLAGMDAAFYLVHSMGRESDFDAAEARSAENFSDAAGRAGLRHIVYLGGLGDDDARLSKHLSSRHRTGEILRAGPVPVTELRAATVIGAGSLSFEMLRYLTEVLPIMTTPRWVRSKCQPIAVGDLLELLVTSLDQIPESSGVREVGGPDVLTYEEMMRIYAREAGLRKRLIIPVPVLSPGLSSLWVGLVTPLPPSVARPLVGSLKNDVIVDRDDPETVVTLTTFRDSVRKALRRPGVAESVEPASAAAPAPFDPHWSGGTVFVDRRATDSPAPRLGLARAFTRIGGENGYYAADWAWTLRGLVDRLLGGPGRRRGRPHPETLSEGDSLDFWKVVRLETGRRLVLEAEMKLPGEAWLEFVAEDRGDASRLVQTAYFRPRGLLGRLYWVALLPAHNLIFSRMARRIAEAAR
jgi:uncharacterized protein YbjT (DUF2867 family)